MPAKPRWGHPTSYADARFALRDDVDACPAGSPVRPSGAGVRPCSARLGSSAASVLSAGSVLRAPLLPYYDFDPAPLASFSLSSELLSWEPLEPLPLALPSTIQAAPGDDVVLVPLSVSRDLGPLDDLFVSKMLDSIVVAQTVRADAGALSRLLSRGK